MTIQHPQKFSRINTKWCRQLCDIHWYRESGKRKILTKFPFIVELKFPSHNYVRTQLLSKLEQDSDVTIQIRITKCINLLSIKRDAI